MAQTFAVHEVIVVDDGSTDDLERELQDFIPPARVIRRPNGGPAAARNLGVASSSGELIAFLDSDDEWLPRKLERQIALYDPRRPDFLCHTDEIWVRNGRVVRQKARHRKQGGRFFERALELCLISPSACVISRSLFESVGGFDESLPAAEDYDLWLRVLARMPVDFVPEALTIKHGGRPDQLSVCVPAIDRFRIKAIVKILDGGELSPEYREAAIRALAEKCRIMAAGRRKRGNEDEALAYERLAARYEGRKDQSR
jgi:glycosyltransferase involved in cell wall biosynthesis